MRVTKWSAALLCGIALALPLPSAAQEDAPPKKEEAPPPQSEPAPETKEPAPETEEPAAAAPAPPKQVNYGEPPLHRWGGMTISVAAWEPSLVGADEELATTYTFGTAHPVMAGSTARTRETVVVLYHLPKNAGSIGISYDSMLQSDDVSYLTPGRFIWGETRAFPAFLGVFNNGFADGVTASLTRKTRDFRLEYSQTAFENSHVKGTWGVGYRQLAHQRSVAIAYLALVPNFPPLIPPATDIEGEDVRLAPIPDQVLQNSNFSGHGLGVTLDLEFPITRRVSIVSGIALGLIRGSTTSAYGSRSSYYFQEPNVGEPLTTARLFEIFNSGTREEIAAVDQAFVFAGLSQASTSQFSETIDIYVGVEVWLWRGLKVFGTLRDVYYANVGQYVTPTPDFSNERTTLNAGYEGYVLGLSWRF